MEQLLQQRAGIRRLDGISIYAVGLEDTSLRNPARPHLRIVISQQAPAQNKPSGKSWSITPDCITRKAPRQANNSKELSETGRW